MGNWVIIFWLFMLLYFCLGLFFWMWLEVAISARGAGAYMTMQTRYFGSFEKKKQPSASYYAELDDNEWSRPRGCNYTEGHDTYNVGTDTVCKNKAAWTVYPWIVATESKNCSEQQKDPNYGTILGVCQNP